MKVFIFAVECLHFPGKKFFKLLGYLEQRVNTEHENKIKARLKKNLEFMGARYAQTS